MGGRGVEEKEKGEGELRKLNLKCKTKLNSLYIPLTKRTMQSFSELENTQLRYRFFNISFQVKQKGSIVTFILVLKC